MDFGAPTHALCLSVDYFVDFGCRVRCVQEELKLELCTNVSVRLCARVFFLLIGIHELSV